MTSQAASRFLGNGAYCYANALAMLLASAGARWAPDTLECLSCVGLGGRWWRLEQEIYFSLVPPDRGIAIALEVLGVEVEERVGADGGEPPFANLRRGLEDGPLLLGPLDMGKLSYLPNHEQLHGCDHFVILTGLGDKEARVHDPLGYPNIAITLEDLGKSWAAEGIAYAKGAYRYWAAPRPGPRPPADALRAAAVSSFGAAYTGAGRDLSQDRLLIGPTAFEAAAAYLEAGDAAALLGQLIAFGLPLGARRAHDMAAFLQPDYTDLAAIKARQAIAFIDAFGVAVKGDGRALGALVRTIGRLDEDFHEGLLGT